MSFLYRTQPALRSLARPSSRLFTATAIQNKSATEAVKETVKGVDRVVSDAAVTGIEKGRKIYLPSQLRACKVPSSTLRSHDIINLLHQTQTHYPTLYAPAFMTDI
jgi:hypothetical protein